MSSQPTTPRPSSSPTTPAEDQPPADQSEKLPKRTRQPSNLYNVSDAGPRFAATKYSGNLYAVDRTTVLDVQIQSKFDRGFFIADNDWTCYRRNYFQVSATFSLHGFPLYYHSHDQHDPELGCLVRDTEGDEQLHPVNRFMIGISAHVADEDKKITLIQHTAKRDKGPQTQPESKPIRPGGDLALLSNMQAASSSTTSPVIDQTIATFERIQFKSATANNGKRRAAQQYYVLVIELFAKIASGRLVRVATNRSAPLVVRGRSPGHYSERRPSEKEDSAALAPPSSSSSTSYVKEEESKEEKSPQAVPSNGYYYQQQQQSSLPSSTHHSPSLPMIPPPPSFDAPPPPSAPPQQQQVVMRAHDRSISAPSGSVDVYNGHGDIGRYGYYQQRDTWNMTHSRMASSGEPYNMPPPPAPYCYYPYNDPQSRQSVVNHHYHGVPSNSRPPSSPSSSYPPPNGIEYHSYRDAKDEREK
ncbi:hypothetical protein BJV82DRAFT_286803 [Fennellomyces sp. T-0311]|nr:hypothetical protein BJV82DRAFT_286803 [Fennellomyces sp. T-0311]